MKLKTKLILSFLAAALVPVVAVFLVTFFGFFNILLESNLDKEYNDIYIKEQQIYNFLSDREKDILFLTQISSLNNLLNSESEELYENKKLELQNDLLNLAKYKSSYYQLRYLDNSGKEVVRINNYGDDPVIVNENKLQNKANRYYFQDTLKVGSGEVLVSPLDLNIENKALENRGTKENPVYVPVLRYYTPVFDNDNTRQGAVVTNIYANNFLKQLENDFTESEMGEFFLVNDKGYYLYNSKDKNYEKEWSFMFEDRDYKFTECGNLDDILNMEVDNKTVKGDDYFCILAKIYPNQESFLQEKYNFIDIDNKDDFWILASKVNKADIYNNMYSTFINVFIIVLILTLLVILLVILISRVIFKPIKKLSEGAKIISQGNLDYKVDINSDDEIGALAKEFNKMASSVKKSRNKIEQEVDKRTQDLEKLNNFMIGREIKMKELKNKIKNKNKKK